MNFVAEQNILRYRALLETETDPDKRAILARLLASQEAKLGAERGIEIQEPSPRAGPAGTPGNEGRGGG